MASLKALIAAAPGVSARPDSVASLIEIIEDPMVEADKLVPVVARDPGLTAGLLKLCNSPLYNFKRRIGSPREALVLVGNLTFARLCFTLCLEPVLHRDLPGYQLDLDTLWSHCLGTAYGAAYLVRAIGLKEMRDRAFTAGLLHDIGKLVLDHDLAEGEVATDRPADDQALADEETVRLTLDFERRHTGFDHAEAGAALLESWDLPVELVRAVRWHHDPPRAGQYLRLARAVHVADKVAHFATGMQAGSQAVRIWVGRTFETSAFPEEVILALADTISVKHQNILSLAAGPLH